MSDYVISFSLFVVYLMLEKYIKGKISNIRPFESGVLVVGVIGLLAVNFSKVYTLENFFMLIIASAVCELWKCRKRGKNQ